MSAKPRPSLIWNSRLDDAVAMAGRVHFEQPRKGTPIAYMVHLFDVASIAIKHGANEDEAVAALLHDTLEDGKNPAALATEIRERFGARVLKLVEACTDTVVKPKPAWEPRKRAYVAALPKKSASAKLVSASDKLANLNDMLEDYRRDGPSFWSRFNPKPEQILWYYRACERGFRKGTTDERLERLLETLRERVKALAEVVGKP